MDLIAEARRLVGEFPVPTPEFEFTIAWPDDYERVFDGAHDGTTDTAELMHEALRVGRVLLHGEGGTGKSTIARRLFKEALEQNLLPVLIDMRRWDASATAEWEKHSGNFTVLAELLLRFGHPATRELELAAATTERRSLVIVDGLNEAPAPVPDGILSALDAFAQRNPHAGVVVTDRLIRRRLPSESWRIAAIAEARMPAGQPRPHGDPSLMRMAFFLDLALRDGLDSTSGSRAFREYLDRHAGIRGDELLQVAHGAYEAYRAARSRTFRVDDFAATAGKDATERLTQSATLVRENGTAYFKHHLFHDFLAGVWLSGHKRNWRSDVFNSVTFGASSFDVLALALEEIDRPDAADTLLRKIYDWNYYGSAYALSKGRSLGTVAATDSMELALLSMLAERRWDPLLATAQRVEDALRLFPARAEQFVSARNLEQIIEIVERASLSPPFEHWRDLFTTRPGAKVPSELVEELASTESLVGWTTANVLKRVTLSGRQRQHVRELLRRSTNEIVRWRAAHVLGSVPERDSADALFDALDDPDQWVRYGAVRSLVELAACHDRLRGHVVDLLKEAIPTLATDSKVIGEFERAILLRHPPADWISAVGPIIEELLGTAETLDEQDHWRQVALRVRRQAVHA